MTQPDETDEMRGETPSHKYARYRYWNEVLRSHLNTDFLAKKHLVVGDPVLIPCLLGMGVPPKNVLAVDPDPEYAQKLQEKNPTVHVICGDIAKVAKRHRRELASAHLHVLNPLSDDLMALVFDILVHGMKDGGFFGMSFSGGGETGKISEGIDLQLSRLDALIADMDHLNPRDTISTFLAFSQGKGSLRMRRDALDALQACVGADEPTPEQEERAARYIRLTMRELFDPEPGVARLDYLMYMMVKQGTPKRVGVRPLHYFHFKEEDKSICYFLSKVTRAFPGSSIEAFQRQFARSFRDFKEIPTIDCNVSEEKLVLVASKLAHINTMSTGVLSDDDKRFLRYLPKLFNISPTTLSKWVTQYEESDDGHGR
jgi:hypothetical protein